MTDTDRGLIFYPETHRYTLDGETVPSVTGILSAAIPKPALPAWAAKSVAEYVADNQEEVYQLHNGDRYTMVANLKGKPWEVRDEAAKRGTEIHDFAEQIVQGYRVDVPEPLVGHVDSCVRFMDDWKIEPVLVEAAVGSREHGYAGKLDLIADHGYGPRAAWDYKSSKSGIYGETAFQVTAYAFAEFYGTDGVEAPMADLGIEEAYGVHVRSDGYTVYRLKFGETVFREFVHLLESSRIIKRALGNWKKPGTGYVGLPKELVK